MNLNEEIINILKNANVQLNENDSYEEEIILKIISKISEAKTLWNNNRDDELLYMAYDLYADIDSLPSFDELETKLHYINDWLWKNLKKKVDDDYSDENAMWNEDFPELMSNYPEITRMYVKMLINYLPRLKELHDNDLIDDEKSDYDGSEEELDESVNDKRYALYKFEWDERMYGETKPEIISFDKLNDFFSEENGWDSRDKETKEDRERVESLKVNESCFIGWMNDIKVTRLDIDKDYNGSEEELDESVVKESYEELDDDVKEIIDIVKRIDDSEMKSTLEELAEELYDAACKDDACCEIAYAFHDKLLQNALEDDDNMVYSVPDSSEVNFDNVADDFYSNLSEDINTYINNYSRYTVRSLMEDIIEICERYFNNNWEDDENDSETIDDEINDNIDDISTLDENVSYDETLENVREIYEKAKESFNAYSHVIYGILTSCEQCGYEELEDFASNFFSDLCSDYCNDSDNWGTEYDGDATYEKCSNIPMKQKIEWYSNTDEIKEFANDVKEKIEYIYDYDFDDDSKNSEIYDGSEDELDESVKEVRNESADVQQLKFFFNKLKGDLESLSDYQKQIEDLPRKIKFDCGTLCFYIENLPEYDEYNKLKSIKDDFRREIFDTIDLENCEYTQYYDEDEELFDGDSTEAMISNLSDKAFIDEFATYYCVEKFCNDVEKEIQALDKMQYYDGSEEELDESYNPEYKVGDKVIKRISGNEWEIYKIEPKWIYIRRNYAGMGMVGDAIYKDEFDKEFKPLYDYKNIDNKYNGSEEELDESFNKKSDGKVTIGEIYKHKGFESLYKLADIDENCYTLKKLRKDELGQDVLYVNKKGFDKGFEKFKQDYDGNDNELDEFVKSQWNYKVGDEVLEVKTGKTWVISEIEPKWVFVKREEGVSRTIHADLIKVEDFPNEYVPLNKDDFNKCVYNGSEEELDESKEESTPLDKLLKLHKEHPEIDIRTIANKIVDGNIEEYISLMKQYYEKFEN